MALVDVAEAFDFNCPPAYDARQVKRGAMGLFQGWAPGDFEQKAADFCLQARDTYNLELDYTARSLQPLDEMITVYFGPGSADDNPHLIVSIGCYVGEVVIRTLGGAWNPDEEFFHSPAVIIPGKLQTRTFPLSRVWRRFEYGTAHSLPDYYNDVCKTLARL
jgi:hypothetical protein